MRSAVAPRRKRYPGAILVGLTAIRAHLALQHMASSASGDTHDTACLQAGLDLLSLARWLDDDAWRSNPTTASAAINELGLLLRAGTAVYGQAPERQLLDLANRSQNLLRASLNNPTLLAELNRFFQVLYQVAMAA